MKIYANQLGQQLQQGLKPCYLIFGDEPFQINDSRRQIKQSAKQAGAEEFIRLTDDDQFDWQDLQQHCQSMSLFASQKVIELELSSGKVAKAGSDILQLISTELSLDTILVLFGPKLDASQTRSAWFKALDKLGLYIPVYDIEGQHLNRWLMQQLKEQQLQMSPDAQQFLLNVTAGNLLATSQELEKLKLSQPDLRQIDLAHVQKFVMEQSKYSVFQLIDAMWQSNAEKCIAILNSLKQEDFEPNIVLWTLQKELLLVQQLQQAQQYSVDPQEVLKQHKVWKNKQQVLLSQANRIPPQTLQQAIDLLGQIDLGLKSFNTACPYNMFSQICILLCGYLQAGELPLPMVFEHE